MGERDAVKFLWPLWSTEVSFGLQASNGVRLISLPEHDGEGLVVFPTSCEVDMGVQEVARGRKESEW